MKKSWERQSGRKRKDRSLTTEENTIKDAGDNFGRVTQKKKKSTRSRAIYEEIDSEGSRTEREG